MNDKALSAGDSYWQIKRLLDTQQATIVAYQKQIDMLRIKNAKLRVEIRELSEQLYGKEVRL